ncbi:hypothetical protein CVT26_008309 [Gymnopilus dilepis]|uniref:Peptidase C14 caspase domain-containing protein n=1 Tax=Gymnopilus dilepis TaxID=231916 RepID=A0A409W9Q8_9AGAR|nr:hypothetical protein CVT26_008309 [Gymnopilus dilepis]
MSSLEATLSRIAIRRVERMQAKSRLPAFEQIPRVPPFPSLQSIDLFSQSEAHEIVSHDDALPSTSNPAAQSVKSEKRKLAEPQADSAKVDTSLQLTPIPHCSPDSARHEIDLFSLVDGEEGSDSGVERSDEAGFDEDDASTDSEDVGENNPLNSPLDRPPPYVESVAADNSHAKVPALSQSGTSTQTTGGSPPSIVSANEQASLQFHSDGQQPLVPSNASSLHAPSDRPPLRSSSDKAEDKGTILESKQRDKQVKAPEKVSTALLPRGEGSRMRDILPRGQNPKSQQDQVQKRDTVGSSGEGEQRVVVLPTVVKAPRQERLQHLSSKKGAYDIRSTDSNVARDRRAPSPPPSSSVPELPSQTRLDTSVSPEGKDDNPILGPITELTGSPTQLSQTTPLPADEKVSRPTDSRLFALVIGISQYQDKKLEPLRGAVLDAVAFKGYFADDLGVSGSRMISLFNEQATRVNILNALETIASHPDIRKDDPIVIFYAGLSASDGARASSPVARVRLLLPHDYSGTPSSVISNRKFERQISNIASKKGDNITVILSCSYSGSFTSARSHMLISACGSSEKAAESNGRGTFSVALLKLFKARLTNGLRYCDVLTKLESLSGQNPQCMGKNQYRKVFSTEVVHSVRSFPLLIKRGSDREATVDAGAAHGITVGAKYAIHVAHDHDLKKPVGFAMVKSVSDFTATLHQLPDVDAANSLVLVKSENGKEDALRLFIPHDTAAFALFKAVGLSGISLVDHQSAAHVKASMVDNGLLFEATDHRITRFGAHPQFGPVNINAWPKVTWTLGRMAHFFSELDGASSSKSSNPPVRLEFYQLGWSDDAFGLKPLGRNLYKEGIIDVVSNHDSPYGVKLINDSPYDLYPYLFLFNCADLSIEDFYISPCLHDSPYVHDIPLQKGNGILTVGYGLGGGTEPFYFPPKDGVQLGISFLKLVFSTKAIDVLHVPQASPLEARRSNSQTPEAGSTKLLSPSHRTASTNAQENKVMNDLWGSIIIPVIQRRHEERSNERN